MKNQIMGFVKRELLSVLVATMVLITALPVGLFDVSVAASDTIYSGECGDDLTWTLDGEGTLTISGTGTMANWSDSSSAPWYSYRSEITKAIIEDGVTSIGNYAFYNCTSLISADIPVGVTSIGDFAFSVCKSLTSIDIPDSVTRIGGFAFTSCSNLNRVNITDIAAWCKITFGTNDSNPLYNAKNLYLDGSLVTELVIPDGVTSIGKYAFYNCTSLTSVDIPDGVTSIGNNAFYNCTNLASVVIPDSVASIGAYAFNNCKTLTSVVIPKSVTSIGNYAFLGCTSLISITVDKDNPNFSSDERGVLFNKHKTKLIQYPAANTQKSYTIPNSVTSIGINAFSGCKSLTSVDIPNSIPNIDYNVFSDCTSLMNVVIPDSVTKIGGRSFSGCTSLESIVIPDSVTRIESYAFYNCKKLTIHGNFGSYAQSYATQNNIPFNAIDNYITSEGVQIRTSGKQGLRFIFSMPKTLYDNISKPTSVENTGEGFGAVVMPKRYLGTEILIKDTVTTVGGRQYAAKTVPAVNIYEITEDEVWFTVVITEISEKNYTAEYVVVPYTTYISGGKENTSYFGLNSISIYSVAQSIYNYGYVTDAEKEYLYNNILTVVDPAKYPPKN